MKKAMLLLLTAAILACCMNAGAEVLSRPLPGLDRADYLKYCMRAIDLAEEKGVGLTKGFALYTPMDPQPLNAYMVTGMGCMYSTNHEMLSVDSATEEDWHGWFRPALKDWMGDIYETSNGGIRFVKDPDQAEILITVVQYFEKSGSYKGSNGAIVSGYACYLSFAAHNLITGQSIGVSFSYIPGEKETVRGGGDFWLLPGNIRNTEQLKQFTDTIMGWYGYGAEKGDNPEGLKLFQQALINRGFMDGDATGVFDDNTVQAVLYLEKLYRLPESDSIDVPVLTAAYYNRSSPSDWGFRYMPVSMPEPSLPEKEPTDPKNAVRGDIIQLGHYEQDADDENGPDPIDWLVLDRKEDQMLVVSLKIIDFQKFDVQKEHDTWDNSSLRSWLNGEFLQEAFTEEEQQQILLSEVTPDRNSKYPNRNQGEATHDRLFLLSLQEAKACFGDDLSPEADSSRLVMAITTHRSNWWLRTAGAPGCACFGIGKGFNQIGDKVAQYGYSGVRPAMWIRLD